MEEGSYTIGEFARITKLNPRTVDFYTRQGLLHPEQARRGHGYRHYTEGDCHRIALIKQLQAQKFSLQEIRRVLRPDGPPNALSAAEAIERVTIDLEKLRNFVQEARSSALAILRCEPNRRSTYPIRKLTTASTIPEIIVVAFIAASTSLTSRKPRV